MKKIITLFAILFLFWACASPNEDGIVKLDGPVLETIKADNDLEFTGAVVNTGDVPVRSAYVVIILRDEDGKIIEANSTPVLKQNSEDILYPSERAFFTLSMKVDPERVVSKDVEIYYDEVKDSANPS